MFRVRQPVTPERDVRDRLLLEDELDTEPDEEEIVIISHAADTGLNIRSVVWKTLKLIPNGVVPCLS